ncbi:HD domain-containing phosphohydrolase [Candidatus Magnetomonas plexicatena]|uniref:HD domain-containing phosphohydrolase n=1 Tax=Candidatus Magnetomonas plexicatena TaxID=2552947 RepID=UPI001C7772D0|nr:HD domain-containing protein [Nitrospirales bacterium LBB_01]
MESRLIGLKEIRIGVPLDHPVYDANGKLMLRRGYVVKSNGELKLLNELMSPYVKTVYHEFEQDLSAGEGSSLIETPFEIIKSVTDKYNNLVEDTSEKLNMLHHTGQITDGIVQCCYDDEDLSLGTLYMDKTLPYTVKHPIHAATVAEIIAKKLNKSAQWRKSLIAAVLTMNISIIELQNALMRQSLPLTDTQRKEIENHPAKSVEMLRLRGVTDELWLRTVIEHHESYDGGGYPNGLKGDEISESARVARLADIYCTMVSERNYRGPLYANEAMKRIFLQKGQGVDETLAMLFIKHLGIYPPGSFVKLKNKEVAVVTERGKLANTPIVKTILRANGFPSSNPIKRDTSEPDYAVVEMLLYSDINLHVNPHKLWGFSDFEKSPVMKRRHSRFIANCPADVTERDIGFSVRSLILNFSVGGCLLKISNKSFKTGHKALKVKHVYELQFEIFDKHLKNIRLQIRNSKITGGYQFAGGQFLDLTDDEKSLIRLYVEIKGNDKNNSD